MRESSSKVFSETCVLPVTQIYACVALAICNFWCGYTFFQLEPDNFGSHSLFLLLQWISSSVVLILFLRQLSASEKRIKVGGWVIHIFSAKILKFLELPEKIHFFRICETHILMSIFSSINGASRILNLNLILMVLNLFCCKILRMYLC